MKIVPLRLASVLMTEAEREAERRRRGYWLRLARENAGPNGGVLNQAVAAKAIGLSERSGSAISDMEKGKREASATELTILARLYGVPVSWFSEPKPTDLEELLEAKRLAADALDDEAADWAAGEQERDPAAEGGADGPRGRRTA